MTARLHRYWFRFEKESLRMGLGCGVTAWTEEDAVALMRDGPFRGKPLPRVASVTVDVDVRTLDKSHIVPNIGSPNRRGVWFPQGFSLP